MTEVDKSKYYIGKKGYSIQKNTLTQTEMYELRNELTVKPNSGMPGYSCSVSYPVYRESTNKMYIPRHFGIEKYGPVSKINISKGESININFKEIVLTIKQLLLTSIFNIFPRAVEVY